MDYIFMGVFLFPGVSLIILIMIFTFFRKQKHLFYSDEQRRKINASILQEKDNHEILNQIENLTYQMDEMQKNIQTLYQKNVNWISVAKRLPPSLEVVSMMINDKCEEEQGYYDIKTGFWTAVGFNVGDKYFPFADISYWKPIVCK